MRRSLLRRLLRWLVGMVGRCCRVRHCGLVSRVQIRTVVDVGIAEIVVDLVGVGVMSSGVVDVVIARRGRSSVRSHEGLILQRLCCRR